MTISRIPSSNIPYPQVRGPHMQARDRLDELKAKRKLRLMNEREEYFKRLPKHIRETVLEQLAIYELSCPAYVMLRNIETEYDDEINELEEMLYGRQNHVQFSAQETDLPPHPFPALFGISYTKLSELHGLATIDEAVGD